METKELEQKIIEAAEEKFRSYGFKCEYDRTEKGKRLYKLEPATGMAAFSIKTIQCGIMVNSIQQEFADVELYVSYNHVGTGSNGYSCYFVALYHHNSLSDVTISLVSSDLFDHVINTNNQITKRLDEEKKGE